MVLAWIAALAAVIALAPMFAGDFDADFGTNGSESEEVAQLLTDRFDRSGEFVTVAWEGADAPGANETVDGFLARGAARRRHRRRRGHARLARRHDRRRRSSSSPSAAGTSRPRPGRS